MSNLVDSLSLSALKAVAIDLDGVVYEGNRLLAGAETAIKRFHKMGLQVYFVTNNSTRTRLQIAEKLAHMGIPASKDEILNSAHAAAILLERLSSERVNRTFVIGSEGLREELNKGRVRIVNDAPCEFLVVGLDIKFDYEKLTAALNALLGQTTFLACNRDANYPAEGGRLLPGCGPIVAAIEAAAGRGPDYCAGKPSTLMLEMLSAAAQLEPSEILMVGDGLESDVAMANHFGSPSVHVLSQCQSNYWPPAEEISPKPSFRVASLAEVPALLEGI